jgi:hypothetical protein
MNNPIDEKVKFKIIALLQAKAIMDIQRICTDKNIAFLVYKGIALSIQLYDQPTARQSGDIDCLVKISELKEFLAVLKLLNYITCTGEEIDLDNYTKYINCPHLLPFHLITNNFCIRIEVHLTTLSNPERLLPCVDLFSGKNELSLNTEKIYTLSHELNFISLINHYVKHFANFFYIASFSNKYEHWYDERKINEIYLFYNKFKDSISLDRIKEIARINDTVEDLELFNCHFQEIYNIRLVRAEDLKLLRNNNQYYQKQLSRFLMSMTFKDFFNRDFFDLYKQFMQNLIYIPTKSVSLYDSCDGFHEKICISNGHRFEGLLFPDYSVYFANKTLTFKVDIPFEYINSKYINVILIINKDKYWYLNKFDTYIDDDGILYDSPNYNRKKQEIESQINIFKNENGYTINFLLMNIDNGLYRYNLVARNQDTHEDFNDHLSISNTRQIYDPTKFCELYLSENNL